MFGVTLGGISELFFLTDRIPATKTLAETIIKKMDNFFFIQDVNYCLMINLKFPSPLFQSFKTLSAYVEP